MQSNQELLNQLKMDINMTKKSKSKRHSLLSMLNRDAENWLKSH